MIISYALSDRLGGAAVQVEEQPSWDREAVSEGRRQLLQEWNNSLSNSGKMSGHGKSSLGLPEIHGERNLEKGKLSVARYAVI